MNASSAILSDCGQYRYHLQRTLYEGGRRLCYIMLNPSTADALVNDATIRICMGRAIRMGYSGIDVVNLFALRSTDPDALYARSEMCAISEPSAPLRNDTIIGIVATRCETVICAWGNHGALHDRGKIVLMRLRDLGVKPMALRLNHDGSPAHPLRISYNMKPFYF